MRQGVFGLYVLYDRIAEESSSPFMHRTDGMAVKMYVKMLTESKESFQEYWLYKLGTYDTVEMVLCAYDKPKRVKVSEGQEEVEVCPDSSKQ